MKQISAPSRVTPNGRYFLRRNGGWWRPDAHGYTDDIAHAGVYSGKDAAAYMRHADGITAVSVKSMRDDLWRQMQERLAEAARLSELALKI